MNCFRIRQAFLMAWIVVLMASCATLPKTATQSAPPTLTLTAPLAQVATPTGVHSYQAVSPVFNSPLVVVTPANPIPSVAVSPLLAPTATSTAQPGVPVYAYRVVNIYPHDRAAFTQGIVFQDGILYEGTGLYGKSTLRKVDLQTGQVLKKVDLPSQHFGEGIAIWGDRVFQLTWQSHVGFIYDRETFKLLGQFTCPAEGWGLTHDGTRLIMSDGTATLHFWDPETLTEVGQVQVHGNGLPVVHLNELEYIKGEVWANVWQTERIVRINPQTGQVVGWIDLKGLLKPEDYAQSVDVLNGIAYDAETDRIFVTGKWWPKLFEIELISGD